MLNDIYQGLDPIAFSLGPLVVRWYGLAYVLGFVCAAAIIYFVAKRWKLGMSEDNLLTLMVCAIVGVVLGARIGYVLFYGDGYYLSHPLEILAFNQGGMSFHGGLVGLLIGGAVAALMTRIPFLTLADLGSIAAPIGLFFGRCANFVNGELWGAPTDGPLGVVFGGAAGMMPRHPSQLYEAVLEGLVIFCVLFALSRKRPPRPQGTFLGAFLVLYGIFRFLIEFVREPDVQLGYLWGGWLTMGQVLSAPLIVAGIALLIYAARTRHPQAGPAGDSAAVCPWRCGLGAPSGFLVTTWCHPALRKSGWHSFQYNISRLRTARLRLFVTSSYKRYEVEHGREILQVHALRQHCC